MLSKNAITVLEKRYLIKDEAGNVIETPEQMFLRIASAVAAPSKSYPGEEDINYLDIFYNMMSNLDFLPNSPTIMNAGRPLGQLAACISGDTLVYTKTGLKRMDKIKSGDYVLTHKRRFRRVNQIWSNGVKDVISLAHGASNRKHFNLTCTPDHKILERNNQWTEAGKLSTSSVIPLLWTSDIEVPKEFNMLDFADLLPNKLSIEDDKIVIHRLGKREHLVNTQMNTCYAKIPNNIEMAKLFGEYLANGNIDDNAIRFTVNSSREELIDELTNIIDKQFGITPLVIPSNHGNWVTIVVTCVFIKNLFESIFGKGFANKQLPEWICNTSIEYRSVLFDYIMHDGTININGSESSSLVLANPTLVYQTLLLGRSINKYGNFTVSCENKLSTSPTSKALFSNSRSINNIVKLDTSESVEVFDMEIDEDHSFIAGDFIVHNCFVLPIENDVSQILQTALDTALIHKSGGGTGFNFTKAEMPQPLPSWSCTFVINSDHKDIEEIRELDLKYTRVRINSERRSDDGVRYVISDDMSDIFNLKVLLMRPNIIDFSNIRPKDSMVSTTKGKASGPASFMKVWDQAIGFLTNPVTPITTIELFNATTEAVKQGGTRRGANMGIVNVRSPYIKEFITCKTNNNSINNFNLSVGLDHEWMSLVTDGDKEAKEIFDMIVHGAWKNGEPGIVFLDEMNLHDPVGSQGVELIEATNPCGEQPLLPYEACITGDTLVLTENGVRRVNDLVDVLNSKFIYSTDHKMRHYNKAVSKGIKPIYQLTLENGLSIKATADHKIETNNNMTELQYIQIGDEISVSSGFPMTIFDDVDELYEMYGWMHGDGWCTDNSIGISFNYADGDGPAKDRLLPYFLREFNATDRKPLRDDMVSYQLQTETNYAFDRCKVLGFIIGRAIDKELPTTFYTWTIRQQLSFIRGLFGADGSIQGKSHAQVYLASTSIKLVEQVQKFLASIGIQSRLFTSEFNESTRNPQHKCAITKASANTFMHVINISSPTKAAKFNQSNYSDDKTLAVTKIDFIGDEEVYDIINVEGTNTFYANGIAVHNCNLGSINLGNMVDTVNGCSRTNWKHLKDTIRNAVVFLDNVIDINKYPIDAIAEKVKKYRKIGLGVMGWADMLCKLKIPYNSDEGIQFGYKVSKFINDTALEMSIELAQTRGSFPGIEETLYKGQQIRNATRTTIAPTGTLSIIANCSSGIEPLFSIVTIRNVMDNTELRTINDVFLDAYQREFPKSQMFDAHMKWISSSSSLKDAEFLPQSLKDIFVTTNDVSVQYHVKMQGAWQENVDNAVSKTINMPNSATEDDVRETYMLIGQCGCKGVTVYRDGSRELQVLNVGKVNKKEEIKPTVPVTDKINYVEGVSAQTLNAPVISSGPITPRPRAEFTYGFTQKITIGCGHLYVTCNWDEHGICEIFTNTGRTGGCPSQSEATSRLISAMLRSGVDVKVIIDQLKGIRCPSTTRQSKDKGIKVLSCPDAIGRVLEKAIEMKGSLMFDPEEPVTSIERIDIIEEQCEHNCSVCTMYDSCNTPKVSSIKDQVTKDLCPECHQVVEHEGGCMICKNCGFSKCS